jgi:hypothetical protein
LKELHQRNNLAYIVKWIQRKNLIEIDFKKTLKKLSQEKYCPFGRERKNTDFEPFATQKEH